MRRRLQRLVRLTPAAALIAAGLSAAQAAPIERRDPPRPLPAISFEARDGRSLSLASLSGKVTVLHVWATWCASCRTEFPSLLKFRETFAKRDVALVTVSIDRLGWPIIDRTLKDLDAEALPVYLDRSREIPSSLGTFGLPFSVVIDRQGREIARIIGAAAWEDAEIAKLIDEALGRE